ncbi:head completion/stabilization protein [Vibrio jasicida]|uniref:Head completion/stabilization protein n=1 Tax=Vibrio jasicida TaxID=766224 RepID=A0ABW7JHK4_9VIBR
MTRFQHQKEADSSYPDEIQTPEFWPNISMSDFQNIKRIPTEYDAGQQRNALVRAINNTIIELGAWEQSQIQAGKTNANQCGQIIDGKGAAESLFISAVYDLAKATLLTHFKTVNRREEANNEAKEERSTYDELVREWQRSVRGILEISSASVLLL